MTVGQKFDYEVVSSFRPYSLVGVGIAAAISQAQNTPSGWGQGWGAYGERYGSSFGQLLTGQTIAFAIEAARHEDPRYIRSLRTGVKNRFFDAIKHTVIIHKDDGGTTLAVGAIVGDFGGGLISRTWRPSPDNTVGDGLQAGALRFGIDFGISVGKEFWPDVRRKLFHK